MLLIEGDDNPLPYSLEIEHNLVPFEGNLQVHYLIYIDYNCQCIVSNIEYFGFILIFMLKEKIKII